MKYLRFCLFFLGILMIVSCHQVGPQKPSNKIDRSNPIKENLAVINHQVIQNEDSLLEVFAQKQVGFEKDSMGFWQKKTTITKNKKYKEKDFCSYKIEVMLLDRTKILVEQKTIELGKKQCISALEACILASRRGEAGELIIPWYLGYGMKGLVDKVPPYTSIYCVYKLN